ncbi:cyclin-dependent kinase [Vairimorpha necatrix]|uniref:Cyclin-dependent kinase 8 n=1 Tax=Vairimorpha necatrix TaxID=6039 RepID=A0AAX4J8P0_9MICR
MKNEDKNKLSCKFTKNNLQYKLQGIIGEGTFGKVYKGIKDTSKINAEYNKLDNKTEHNNTDLNKSDTIKLDTIKLDTIKLDTIKLDLNADNINADLNKTEHNNTEHNKKINNNTEHNAVNNTELNKKIKSKIEYFGIKKINQNKDGLHITTIREIKTLRKLNHKNIINLLEINVENSEIFLIFPYVRFDLNKYLKKNIPNKKEIIHIIKQISEGLKYLKSQNILHRDIKTSNILLDFDLNIKIADFGMSIITNKNMNHSPGVVTLWYRPPEILLNLKYNFQADIWGLGCILGEIIQGKSLFTGNTEIKVLECIILICGSINEKSLPNIKEMDILLPQSQRNLRKIFKNSDEELVDLLDKIMKINPEERLTIENILEDKIFKNYDGEFINNISKKYEHH